MSILDEIDKGISLQPAGSHDGSLSARPLTLLERIRQTYPQPPAVAAQVAQQGAAAVQQAATATPTNPSPKRPARPFVSAVWEPANLRGDGDPGGFFFDDSLSQAERKEFIEALDWFNRQDARKKQARKKQAVKSDTEILVAEI
jgi:hypothetical protein